MRVLAAVDHDLHPPLAGATQRWFGLLRGLARRHEVHALSVVPYRSRGAAHETVAGVTIERRRRWYTSAAWRLEQLGLAPLALAAVGHARAARGLLAAIPGPADALLADLSLAALLDHADVALRVHASQNVEADVFHAVAPRLLARGAWERWLRAREARAVGRADVVVVCSDEDAARMTELYGVPAGRFEVAPNGWDETALRPPSPAERARARAVLELAPEDYAVLFLGSDWPPNREALRLLVERVMPPLADLGIRLVVAGGVAVALAGRRDRWLRAVGPVRDPLAVMHACDAGINPVLAGGGSNVKLAGYLGTGLAAIATPFGARGFPDLAAHVTVAPAAALAEALRARPRGWAARGESLPPAVARHAWGAIGARLGDALEARRAPGRAVGRSA